MSEIDILQIGTYTAAADARLGERFRVHRQFERASRDRFLREQGAIIRGVATRGDLATGRDMMEAMPSLEIIAVYGAGYDGVDVKAAAERGIRVTNTPDILSSDVADLAVGLMISALRRMRQGDRWVRSGDWAERGAFPLQRRIRGRTAGILGMGRIGRAIANRVAAFEMTVAYTARARKPDAGNWRWVKGAAELAECSDVLFVALDASAETAGIVDRKVLDALGPEGVLVNVSRGTTVDEAALLDALESGRLGQAGLDVFLNEPAIDSRFRELDNVAFFPHSGSGTAETRRDMGDLVLRNLLAHFEGRELPTPVN